MTEPTYREGLPPLPRYMLRLPLDERGYPVPFFVAWVNGKPDHRVADASKVPRALKSRLCWLCGSPLGAFMSFVIGPMCSITRTISEPPSHLECATYAAQACPFLSRPQAKRREANLPDERQAPAGIGIRRNPGVVCVWTTRSFAPYRQGGGLLFELGDPEHTEWFAEGRRATRAEVDTSIRTGLPLLVKQAEFEDGVRNSTRAALALERAIGRELAWLDRQAWPEAVTSLPPDQKEMP